MATPFELRAIRLNVYQNVIINSASVADLVLLIKRALDYQNKKLAQSKSSGRQKTTELDMYGKQVRGNQHYMVDPFELTQSARARKSANLLYSQNNYHQVDNNKTNTSGQQKQGFFGNFFHKKNTTAELINMDNTDNSIPEFGDGGKVGKTMDELDSPNLMQMEFASKSLGQQNYLATHQTSHFVNDVKDMAFGGTQTVGSYPSSNYEDNSILPNKDSKDSQSPESIDQIMQKRGRSAYEDRSIEKERSNRTSFFSRRDQVSTSFDKQCADRADKVGNARSMIDSTSRSENQPYPLGNTDKSTTSSNKICSTRICNFREVKNLFEEHEANHESLDIDMYDSRKRLFPNFEKEGIYEDGNFQKYSKTKHTQQTLQIEMQQLPEALRVKPFVISTEDIKMVASLMIGTIEIEKVHDFKLRQYRNGLEDTDTYGKDITEFEASELDLSCVQKQPVRKRKPIEVFSGSDPIFNCKNLALRVRGLQRKQVCYLSIVFLLVAFAITSVLLWFKIVLNGYSQN